MQLVREGWSTAISACWATLEWSWPKEWNLWARADLHFQKKKKEREKREREITQLGEWFVKLSRWKVTDPPSHHKTDPWKICSRWIKICALYSFLVALVFQGKFLYGGSNFVYSNHFIERELYCICFGAFFFFLIFNLHPFILLVSPTLCHEQAVHGVFQCTADSHHHFHHSHCYYYQLLFISFSFTFFIFRVYMFYKTTSSASWSRCQMASSTWRQHLRYLLLREVAWARAFLIFFFFF